MWPRSIIAAWLAPKKALTDGDATGSRHGRKYQITLLPLPEWSGLVPIAAKPSRSDGAQSMDLTPRAYRLANRNKDQAERYLSLHQTLNRRR
jgi:hypothetical protein